MEHRTSSVKKYLIQVLGKSPQQECNPRPSYHDTAMQNKINLPQRVSIDVLRKILFGYRFPCYFATH